jgi:hypothetical protein
VAEAIAWGWIDGIRKSVNETSWQQRFTSRKPGSSWSQINIARQNGSWDAASPLNPPPRGLVR